MVGLSEGFRGFVPFGEREAGSCHDFIKRGELSQTPSGYHPPEGGSHRQSTVSCTVTGGGAGTVVSLVAETIIE
jgi:hypothetical protein